MKNFNIKKTVISLVLGLALVLSVIPTNLGKLLSSSAATIKEAYPKPAKVEINGKFEETASAPSKWTLTSEYEDIDLVEGKDDNDSTSYNGIVPTEMAGFNAYYKDLIEDWLETWDKSHEYSTSKKQDIKDKLEEILNTSPLLTNPLVHDYDPNSIEEHKVLAMLTGSTFYKYLKDDESGLEVLNQDRNGFITYTSNEFKLDQYSFYKITIYVKTTDGAKVNISLTGDIEKDAFTNVQTASSTPTMRYYYTFSDGNNTTKFFSETANTASSLTYNGHVYKLEGNKFVPDTTDPNYSPSIDNYSITYNNDCVLASSEGWEKKTIYISTTTEAKLKLKLMLGSEDDFSTGNAFFDDIEVTKIQLLDFYQNAINGTSTVTVDNREILSSNQNNTESRNYTTLEDFEDGISWTAPNVDLQKVDITTIEEGLETGFEDTFPSDNLTNKNFVLKVNAHDSVDVILNSDTIELGQNRYYRISFSATSTNASAKLTAELVGTKADGATSTSKDTTKPYYSDRDNKDASNVNNFWANYVYYVRSTAETDTEAYLKLTISAGQIIYFDNLVIETVTRHEFDNTNYNKLDLSTTFKEQILANGNFFNHNSVDIEHYSKPLPPSSWVNKTTADVYEYYKVASQDKFDKAFLEDASELTFNAEKTTITYEGKEYVKAEDSNNFNYKEGDKIVSKFTLMKDQRFDYDVTKSAYYDSTHKLEKPTTVVAGVVNGTTKASNILHITTTSSESTTFQSDVMKLSSTSSMYIIAVDVKTDIATRANIRLVDKNGKIYATMNDISTYNATNGTTEWTTVKFYVGTGLETIELFLDLEFVESIGTLEFKNTYALKTSSTTILDAKLNKTHEELQDENIRIVNLAKETFIEHADKLNSTTHLYDAHLYEKVELNGKTSGIYGVVDTSDPHSDFASITAKDGDSSPYVLVVKNNTGESTQINSIKSFTVAKQKALQITLTAKVEGLTEGKFATISFGDLNAAFEIKENEFTEYTLYVDNLDAEVATKVKYYISMLDTAGTLVIDNITVSSLSSLSTAESQYPDGDTDTVKFVKTTASKAEEEKKEEKDDLTVEDENNTLEIFLAVFSSLLLVASIVFAIAYTRFKALHKPRKRSEKNLVSETDDGQKGFI